MPDGFLTANRSFFGLLAANTILGTSLPLLIILGGLAGLMLAPTVALSTLPASLQTLAGLFAAAPFSLVMGRFGRRVGFALGGLLGAAGALWAAFALIQGDFLLLCLAHMALGAALACYQYFRFAAAEVVSTQWQPVAISLMLTSGLIAALIGPQVFILTKDAMIAVPLLGAYLSLAGLSLIGLLPLLAVRMPSIGNLPERPQMTRQGIAKALQKPPVRRAIGTVAVAQGVMVFMMVPTPLAMIGCGLSDTMAGDVIRWHVVAMFAPSFFTGFLIQRFGTQRMCQAGLTLLIIAAAAGAAGLTPAHFYGALIILGVGWNFAFIGATTLLAQVVAQEDKALTQGVNDTIIALSSTIFAFAGGGIVAAFGWAALALSALGVVALALVMLTYTERTSAV